MKALVYGSPAGTALFACEKLGIETFSMPYKASSIEDMMFGGWLGFPQSEGPFDLLCTSGTAELVKPLLKQIDVPIILWDMGPKPSRKDINAAIVPLQLLGYDVVVLTNLSVHTLGYNYIETRAVVVARKGAEVAVKPSKLKISRPYTPLASICRTDTDEYVVPVFAGSRLFHRETRPWSYVSVPKANTYLLACQLSTKCGAVWYNIGGKLHRLTVSEAAAVVGYPLEAQLKLTTLCEDSGMLVYNILRDLAHPMWTDLFERIGLCE